jgi:hypothetical protein
MNDLIRPTTWQDVEDLSHNLRVEDIEEASAHGQEPFDALATGVENSTVCYTLFEPNGTPAAILGVAPGVYPRFGAVWLLGSTAIERHGITFLRNSKAVLLQLYEETGCDALYNYTYGKNTVHHRWLRWLGFKFIAKHRLGVRGDLFYEFVRLKGG